jgi:membrane associated rhomboid family serine protease
LFAVRTFSRGPGYRYDLSGYFPPAIKAICIACISVFTLQAISQFAFGQAGTLWWLKWFGLAPYAVTHGWIWQLFTYIFLHAGILHILFNLLYLAMFGADLERAWGSKKFYTYFFLCGIGAGVINVVVKEIIFYAGGRGGLESLLTPTIGASGAIYGVLLAVAIVMPHRQVYVFPLPVTISMRMLVIVLGAIEFFGTIGSTGDNVSHVCHLGGMLIGYIYLRRGSFGYNLRNSYSDWQRRRLKKKFEVYVRDQQDKPPSRPDNWLN